jgi:dTDP-L-rhamnose 4-epimerase
VLHGGPVLITGGAGFIGSRLSARLAAGGHAVHVLDNLHPQVHPDAEVAIRSLASGVSFLHADVTDHVAMHRLIDQLRPCVVVHLAAETGTGQSLREATRHGSVNVVGTTTLLDACSAAEHLPDRIVLTSSRAVYGEGLWQSADGLVFAPHHRTAANLAAGIWDPPSPDGRPARPLPHDARSTPPDPTNIYAATKLAQEHIINSWCAALGSNAHVLRLQNVYGPGQSPTNSYTGVLTFFAQLVKRGEAIPVYEDGNIVRDFVYIDDVVDELVAEVTGAGHIGARDVGSGAASTIGEVAALMASIGGSPAPVVTGAYRGGDVRAASAAPGVGHRTSLSAGLSALLDVPAPQGER